MSRKPLIRVGAAVFGGIVVAVFLLGFLAIANAREGFAGCLGATALGWTIPLIAGGLAGAASWFLLTSSEEGDTGQEMRSSACGVCGKAIIDEWRLCPYCGSMTDGPSGARRTAERPAVE